MEELVVKEDPKDPKAASDVLLGLEPQKYDELEHDFQEVRISWFV